MLPQSLIPLCVWCLCGGSCLRDAAEAVRADVDSKSERCQHFYQAVLPLAFEKLMTEKAVRGWNHTTQSNVFARTEQFLLFFVSSQCRCSSLPAHADIPVLPVCGAPGGEAGAQPRPWRGTGGLERLLRKPEPRVQDVSGRGEPVPRQELAELLVLPGRVGLKAPRAVALPCSVF